MSRDVMARSKGARRGGGDRRRSEPITLWLGEEISLEGGLLRFEGCLRIEGRVEGTHLHGPSIVIGENARVSGSLETDRLTVLGRLDAFAQVHESAVVEPGGEFLGELQLERPVLSVVEGGKFQGRIKMMSEASAEASSPERATPAPSGGERRPSGRPGA